MSGHTNEQKRIHGMRDGRIARAALAAVILITAAGSGWTGGAKETANQDKIAAHEQLVFSIGSDSNDSPKLQCFVSAGGYFGGREAKVVFSSTEFAVLRKNGNEYSHMTKPEVKITPEQASLISSLSACFSSAAGSDLKRVYPANMPMMTDAYFSESSQVLVSNLVSELKGVKEQSSVQDEGSFVFSNSSYGNEDLYEMLLFKKSETDTYEYSYLKFTMYGEFFTGEKEIFESGKIHGTSYREKALNYLAAFFMHNDSSDDKALAERYTQLVSKKLGVSITQTADSTGSIDPAISATFPAFRRAFSLQFLYRGDMGTGEDGRQYVLPYLDYSRDTFRKIYGPSSARNPYTEAYLLFLSADSSDWGGSENDGDAVYKPVLSSLFLRSFDGSDIRYDPSAYRRITKAEGEALAERALRYLFWGVEYTPYAGEHSASSDWNTTQSESSSREVYRVISGSSWITGGTVGTRENNYAPKVYEYAGERPGAEATDASGETLYPRRFALDSAENKVKITAAGGSSVSLSRIDIWSAENLAWERNESAGALMHGFSVDEYHDKDDLPADVSAARAMLNDGRMVLNSETENLHIPRPDGTSIAYGYLFDEPRHVGAIGVVRGKVEHGAPFNNNSRYPVTDAATAKVQIWVRGSDGEWYNVPLKNNKDQWNWRERSVDVMSNSIVAYPEYEGRVPGCGLWSGRFSNGGTSCSVSYFVFSDEARARYLGSARGIAVVDGLNTGYVNISELYVFDGDPLQYLRTDDGATAEREYFWAGRVSVPEGVSQVGALSPDRLSVNGAMETDVRLSENGSVKPSVTVSLGRVVPVRQVVVWEPKNTVLTSQSIQVMGGSNPLFDAPYAAVVTSGTLEAWNTIANRVNTPFYDQVVRKPLLGNPLPYAPLGIDSPRTFAYKMSEQLRAREWMRSYPSASSYIATERFTTRATTRALDASGYESYKEGYAEEDEVLNMADSLKNLKLSAGNFEYTGTYLSQASSAPKDLSGKRVKPFLPGLYLNTPEGYKSAERSPYHPDKIAGVDAVGLTLGSIAMDSFAGRFHNAFGEAVASSLDDYYKMDKSDIVPGLDEKGLPAFYSVGSGIKSTLEGAYRLTRGDIERATVLIPNISMIRKGDLLVRYDVTGEPHIGIVAGLGWTTSNGPSWTADARDWWTKVFVVSVRRGYRTVSLGSWGNSSTVFGGFSASPESYQIRRLLVKRDEAVQQNAEPPEWELVDEVAVRLYTDYPSNLLVPRDGFDVNLPTNLGELKTLEEQFQDMKNGAVASGSGRFYLKLLPPTSFSDRPSKYLPLTWLNSGVQTLRSLSLTGWRKLSTFFRYHTGLDISNQAGPTLIRAPEDGVFYIYDESKKKLLPNGSIEDFYQSTNKLIPITLLDNITGQSEVLTLSSYEKSTYGNVGVLITNPEAPRNGRVYVFAHMESDADLENLGQTDTMISSFYNSTWGQLPDEPAKRITVKAGDYIGYTGGGPIIPDGSGYKRKYDVHTHVEVYEYFEEVEGDNVALKPNDGWQRVDPLSVFISAERLKSEAIDLPWLKSMNDGSTDQSYYSVYLNSASKNQLTPEEAKNAFRTWMYWDRIEDKELSW